MAQRPNFLAYCDINGYRVCVEVSADKPEDVLVVVGDLFKEIESKVGSIRIADAATGFYLRGFS